MESGMDFRRTEEQELLIENLRELLDRECPESYVKELDAKHEYPEKLVKAMVDNGFGLLGIPEEYGGVEVDISTQMMVSEEIARHGAPAYLFGSALSIDDVLTFGSDEQKKATMECAKAGKMAFCLGFSEPQAGSDTNAITTTATRRNGKVYINGQKTFTSFATQTPYMLCITRDFDVEDIWHSFSMWWVPMDAPGVTTSIIGKIGWNMSATSEVYLNDVEIEEKDLVGVEGNGHIQLMKNFETERALMAAAALGQAECAFDDAAKYATQRVVFGKTIGTYQMIQEKLVQMAIKIENMRNYVYKTAWEKDSGISIRYSSALCKLYCAQASFEVIDDALQILGGLGYSNESRVSRLWRDNRMTRIGGGTDEIMIHIAAKGILNSYKD
jgi:alkylation response protein AidB-like acyl-CoA dehydrogenase